MIRGPRMRFNWRHDSYKIRVCEICTGKGRNERHFRDTIADKIQGDGTYDAMKIVSFRVKPITRENGTFPVFVCIFAARNETSMDNPPPKNENESPSRNPFMQISTASHLTPLKPRPGQIFTRRRYLYEPLNARSTHDIVFSRMKVIFFLLFLEKLGKKARRRREGN